jgi:hypothetical protein
VAAKGIPTAAGETPPVAAVEPKSAAPNSSPFRRIVTYSYRVYGLELYSSVIIAGLEPHSEANFQRNVQFESGPQPDWVNAGLALPGSVIVRRQAADGSIGPTLTITAHGENGCFELAYADDTRFVVSGDAARIWGTFLPPLTPEDLATYLLGPIMGFLLRLRGRTCLHASAVRIGDCGVALVGDAGFGKSTTAAALALRGVSVCSEDIVPLAEVYERFEIVPGYPRVCLWPDSVEMLLGSKDALPLLTPVWDKRYLPLDGKRAKFADENSPLGMIYLFAARSDSEGAPRVEELRPKEALLELVQNTYMNWLPDPEQRAREFDVLARLVDAVPVRRIVPHTDPRKIRELCDLIIDDAKTVVAKR